jgi:hypothetical protein
VSHGDQVVDLRAPSQTVLTCSAEQIMSCANGQGTSGAAWKFVERGSCCHLGVIDPLEGLGCLAVVFDERQHLGHEVVA